MQGKILTCAVCLGFFILTPTVFGATKYWVGGTGNWSDDVHHWATTSGGVPGSGNLPTSTDDCIFDSASSGTSYTATLNVVGACNDLTLDNPAVGVLTLAGGNNGVSVYGSFLITTSTVVTSGNTGFIFKGAGTSTITTNGATIGGNITFNASGTIQLADDLTYNGFAITFAAGTFDPNGKLFNAVYAGNLQILGAQTPTFYDFARSGQNNNSAGMFIGNTPLQFTVAHNLVLNGFSASTRLFIYSNTVGTPATITASSLVTKYTDFRDITASGTADWNLRDQAIDSSGDAGGNSGITFTVPATEYWYTSGSVNRNWTATSSWFAGSGGTGGLIRVPLPQDTAMFDNNSFGDASTTVTLDANAQRLPSVDFSNVTVNPPTLAWLTTSPTIFGSLNLAAGMQMTSGVGITSFMGRTTSTITSAGVTWPSGRSINVGFSSVSIPGLAINLSDDLLMATNTLLNLYSGTFDAQNHNVRAGSVRSTQFAGVRTINMGSGTWEVSGVGTSTFAAWYMYVTSNLTVNIGSSTLKMVNSSSGIIEFDDVKGRAYNTLWLTGSGTGPFQLACGTSCGGNSSFNTFIVDTPPHTVKFRPGSLYTINSFNASGTAGNLLTLTGITSSTWGIAKAGGGKAASDYLSLSYSSSSPSSTWYAGANSIDGGNNSNWIFNYSVPDPPTDLTAAGGSSYAALSWTPPEFTGGAPILYYVVDDKLTASSTWTTSIATSTFASTTVSGLVNGSSYDFRVSAVNSAGQGSVSATASTTPANVPGAPTSVSAVGGNAQATISFTAPVDDGGSSIIDYVVTANPGSSSTVGTSSPITMSGLANGTSYTFTVTAVNAVGTGATSTSSNAVTPATVPGVPTNLAASALGSSVGLSWSAPSSTGGAPLTNYVVEYEVASSGTWATFGGISGTNTTGTVTGLSNGTSYAFRVSAVNSAGQGSSSVSVMATPGEPAQVIIQSFPSVTTPNITTAVRITNEGSAPYEYQYRWCVASSSVSQCGSGADIFTASAAKLVQNGENFDTSLGSTVSSPGNYWFVINVSYGSNTSTASASFTAVASSANTPAPTPSGGGGGGGGTGYYAAPPVITQAQTSSTSAGGSASGSLIPLQSFSGAQLVPGASGNDVTLLQQYLAKDPDIYPEGLVTGYFGPLTEKAVRRFQVTYDIVSTGSPETTGYGAVGPLTRAKLVEVFGGEIQKEAVAKLQQLLQLLQQLLQLWTALHQ